MEPSAQSDAEYVSTPNFTSVLLYTDILLAGHIISGLHSRPPEPQSAHTLFQTEISKSEAVRAVPFAERSRFVAQMWKDLPPAEAKVWHDKATEMKAAFAAWSAQRDAEVEAERAARRAAIWEAPEDRTQRGARAAVDAERVAAAEAAEARRAAAAAREEANPAIREAREERLAEAAAQRAAVQSEHRAREKVLNAQLKALREKQAAAQRRRVSYLLGESDLFRRFLELQEARGEPGVASHPALHSPPRPAGSAAEPAPVSSARRARKDSGQFSDAEEDEAMQSGASSDSDALVATGAAESDDEAAPAADEAAADSSVHKGRGHGHIHAATRLTAQPSCITGQMRDYQLEGLNWMISLQENGLNGVLADEMGLGKTLQTISLLGYTAEYRHLNGPHLILVPKSTLSNWMAELARWCPRLRALCFHGTKDERKEICDTLLQPGQLESERQWDVVVTTYEMANIEKNTLRSWPWVYLVIDEAHRIKNESSALATTVREFAVAHRLLITGTPLQNNLHELWALLNFLLPDVFGDSEAFAEWFDVTTSDDSAEVKTRMVRQLHAVLRPFMLRRLKSDVAKGLPPKKETFLYVGLTSKQREVYRSVLKKDLSTVLAAAEEAEGRDAPAAKALMNSVMQLRKTCNHPYLFDGVEDRTLPPLGEHLVQNCAKLKLLDKLLPKLRARGSRVLIFSQMTRMLDILEDYLTMRYHAYCRIDGQTSYEDREAAIQEFNAPNSKAFAFLLSTRAGGLGINLATADTVVLYDSDWNPQSDLQAQDRAHRIGQTRPVSVFRLITTDTVEEKIVERAMIKLKLDAVVVQQARTSAAKRLSKADMMRMVQFGADAVFKAADDEGGDVTDQDIDAILAAGEARTAEVQSKASALSKLHAEDMGDGEGDMDANLLDFKLDGTNTRTFEGVDYAAEAQRKASDRRALEEAATAAALEDEAARGGGRRARVIDYNVAKMFKSARGSGKLNPVQDYRRRLAALRRSTLVPAAIQCEIRPWLPNCTPMNMLKPVKDQLLAIAEHELSYYNDLLDQARHSAADSAARSDWKPWRDAHPEKAAEAQELLATGFPAFTKVRFDAFVNACRRHGRRAVRAIIADMVDEFPSLPARTVRAYYNAFWFGLHTPEQVQPEEDAAPGAGRVGTAAKAAREKQTSNAARVGRWSEGWWQTLPDSTKLISSIQEAERRALQRARGRVALDIRLGTVSAPIPGTWALPLLSEQDVRAVVGDVAMDALPTAVNAGSGQHGADALAAVKAKVRSAVTELETGSATAPIQAWPAALRERGVLGAPTAPIPGCGNPWQHVVAKPTGRTRLEWSPAADTAVMCLTAQLGWGRWRAVHAALLRSPALDFDLRQRSTTPADVRSRAVTLLRTLLRELDSSITHDEDHRGELLAGYMLEARAARCEAALHALSERATPIAAAFAKSAASAAPAAKAAKPAKAAATSSVSDKPAPTRRATGTSRAAVEAANAMSNAELGVAWRQLTEAVPSSVLSHRHLLALARSVEIAAESDLDKGTAFVAEAAFQDELEKFKAKSIQAQKKAAKHAGAEPEVEVTDEEAQAKLGHGAAQLEQALQVLAGNPDPGQPVRLLDSYKWVAGVMAKEIPTLNQLARESGSSAAPAPAPSAAVAPARASTPHKPAPKPGKTTQANLKQMLLGRTPATAAAAAAAAAASSSALPVSAYNKLSAEQQAAIVRVCTGLPAGTNFAGAQQACKTQLQDIPAQYLKPAIAEAVCVGPDSLYRARTAAERAAWWAEFCERREKKRNAGGDAGAHAGQKRKQRAVSDVSESDMFSPGHSPRKQPRA